MKNILKLFLIVISVSLSGCSDFLDVNDNPNSPVSENLSLSAKLPAALVSSVNQETIQINQIGAFWGGYWGTSSEGVNLFPDMKNYNGPAIRHQRDGIPVWENAYTNILYYQLIREQAITERASFYAGIAKIMQAWHFLRLVDFYNNIPFDEGLQGTKFPTPKYETGKSVYEKSIALISEGMTDIKSSAAGSQPNADDILFKGNKVSWLKFANTIKLRALLRQSEANNSAYITTEMQKITQEGSGFLGVGESATIQPGYLLTAGKMNPFWENYYRNVQGVTTANYTDIRPTSFVIQQYQLRNDPRLAQLYVAVNGEYKGVLFGNPNAESQYNRNVTSAFKGPQENTNRAAGLFKSATQASVMLSSFESLFLQAEAAQRGWLNQSAKSLYEQAISESFVYMGVATAQLPAYFAQTNVAFNETISRIIEQKWLAINSISSIEAWNDFRRLGIPAIPNSLDAASPNDRPLRFMYPETERQTNNVEASKQGSDDMISARVWWDVN
ncbi:SusD/RagB family nutrient-binding outer membrane lipoprotein [Arcicella sp. DC2W]|uniref:SusD/RagB family nutrient-binding outer membrane lipoprotein n=1 Tax=Arcicella gelida TaxID=2984195 RepID=A0ABU5S480_9BACT|nr:SusD/RagB family nutrient-binding outer membrane lipoprotein [Arcicella sp. DC2W]MEA5403289.1 SusD/RagB family nutrient-binding outer membrane lipoprotein [Arcicella sp. DC2W]